MIKVKNGLKIRIHNIIKFYLKKVNKKKILGKILKSHCKKYDLKKYRFVSIIIFLCLPGSIKVMPSCVTIFSYSVSTKKSCNTRTKIHLCNFIDPKSIF